MASIIVLDDENHVRLLVKEVLEAMGHQVIEATNGKEALESLRDSAPSLLIIDILMPEMDGIETIRAIRRTNTDLPILAISGGFTIKNVDVLELARRLGATQILQKPFDIWSLMAMVQSLLAIKPRPAS